MIQIEDQIRSDVGLASADEENFCVLSPLLKFVTTPKHLRNEFKVQRCVVLPGVASSLHRHDSVEILYLLEGYIEVFRSGKWTSASAGSIVGTSAGALHELRNEGAIPATFLCLIGAYVDTAFPLEGSSFHGNYSQGSPTNEEVRQFFVAATRHAYLHKSQVGKQELSGATLTSLRNK